MSFTHAILLLSQATLADAITNERSRQDSVPASACVLSVCAEARPLPNYLLMRVWAVSVLQRIADSTRTRLLIITHSLPVSRFWLRSNALYHS